jgi:hypothetical protein
MGGGLKLQNTYIDGVVAWHWQSLHQSSARSSMRLRLSQSSNNEAQYQPFGRHDTTPKAHRPRYSLLLLFLRVWTEFSQQVLLAVSYRTVVYIVPVRGRKHKISGASASQLSPAPQILKHSLIHPANILPKNQTKPNHPIFRFQPTRYCTEYPPTPPSKSIPDFPLPRAPGRAEEPFLFLHPMDLCIMHAHLISSHIILTVSKQNQS